MTCRNGGIVVGAEISRTAATISTFFSNDSISGKSVTQKREFCLFEQSFVFIKYETRHLDNFHDNLEAAVMLFLVFHKDQDIIHVRAHTSYHFDQLRHLPHEDI